MTNNKESAPGNKPLVTVSLLLWNSEKFIKNCLGSLLTQSFKGWELIISDNNEQPDKAVTIAQELVREQDNFSVFFIKNKGNIGFTAGHNQAIAKSRGKYVLLLNHDVILAPDYLEKALIVLRANPKAYGVQARCLKLKEKNGDFIKTNLIDNFGLVMLKNRRVIARGQGQKASGRFLKEEEIFGVDGAVPLYRKEALEDAKICLDGKCEYLDEDFLSYKEDVDLAWRMRLFGWRAIYSPTVVAWHARGSGDSAQTSYAGIIRERRKINDFAKTLAFRNQRLMQLKNELGGLLFWHLPYFLTKEILSWLYFLLFEWRNRQAIVGIFKLAPRMLKKRKIIMNKRKVGLAELKKWFY